MKLNIIMLASLTYKTREKTGKYLTKKLKENNSIPAVIYSLKGAKHISLNSTEVMQWYKKQFSEYQCLELTSDSDKIIVFPRNVDLDPVTEQPKHIELQIKTNDKQVLNLPVLFKDVSKSMGIKQKGTLLINKKTVKVECTLDIIPSNLVFEGESLKIGQKITIKNLTPIEGITIKENPNTIIAVCKGSRLKEETNTTEEQEKTTASK